MIEEFLFTYYKQLIDWSTLRIKFQAGFEILK